MGKYDILVSHLRECAKLDKSENTFTEAANAIEELESRFEREKGKWEYKPSLYPYGVEHFECSLCSESVVDRTNFCPYCGADMR